MNLKIEMQEVFTINGIPKHTFVKAKEFTQLFVAMKTPGRCIVLEGPSGIGKTSAFFKAMEELPEKHKILTLSARKEEDRQLIKELPNMKPFGFLIIDDFHKLSDDTKKVIADLMKTMADESDTENKIVVAGINKAGENLISFASDLTNRIEIIKFESNSIEKVEELISKGEEALKIKIKNKDEIATAAQGSFFIAQLLCYHLCLQTNILVGQEKIKEVITSFELVKAKVFETLSRRFYEVSLKFAQGNRLYKEGRAPYLQLLYWLSSSDDWALNLNRVQSKYTNFRGSITQITTKGYLNLLIERNSDFSEILYYQKSSNSLIVQDPQYIFFLKNISWKKFAEDAGYLNNEFKTKYDFALSFSGTNRKIAEKIFETLQERQFEVFYDKNEQYRILAEDVEDYLKPIYQSEAIFVVVLLTNDYPTRIWTKIESEAFKDRINNADVIPIVFSDCTINYTDKYSKIGHLSFDLNSKSPDEQVIHICDELQKKIGDRR